MRGKKEKKSQSEFYFQPRTCSFAEFPNYGGGKTGNDFRSNATFVIAMICISPASIEQRMEVGFPREKKGGELPSQNKNQTLQRELLAQVPQYFCENSLLHILIRGKNNSPFLRKVPNASVFSINGKM